MQILYASFADPVMAEKAVGALMDQGVKSEDISLVFSEAYVKTKGGVSTMHEAKDVVEEAKRGVTTTTEADAAVGTAKGAGIGLGVGTLAALASLFVPGVGLVTGAGVLATALGAVAGSIAAGAVVGGVAGFLEDQGVPQEAARKYDETLIGGGAVIAIRLPSMEVSQAGVRQTLSKYQAVNFGTYAPKNS